MQRWPEGEPIWVQSVQMSTPRRLRCNGAVHAVEVLTRWRVDEEWWADRVWCELFQLITTSCLLATV